MLLHYSLKILTIMVFPILILTEPLIVGLISQSFQKVQHLTGLSITFIILNVYAIIFSFGHELGHNFGAMQNPEVEEFPGEAHGHLIMV